jgi:hypothetical protein
MPRAFTSSNEVNIHGAITRMAMEQRFMAIRNWTIEDLRQLFIPAEHRDAVRQAFAYARQSVIGQVIGLPIPNRPQYSNAAPTQPLVMTLRWDYDKAGADGFFAPANGRVEVQPDASPELLSKLEDLYQDITRITWEFGLVQHVFKELNVNGYCNTPQQMRFLWPAIRHLCDKGGLGQLGKQLIEASPRAGDRARVPAHLDTELLVQTMHIVARTLVIGEVDFDDKRDFVLSVSQNADFVLANGRTFQGVT